MLQRFQHILVPLDFTAKNRSALDVAFEIAVQNRSHVTLLHVIETLEDAEDDEEVARFYERLERRANCELDTAAQRFAEAGLDADFKVRYGKRASQIVEDVQERGIDLVIMSSHAIDPQQIPQSMGTLSYQVSILCPCPILLVK